MRKNFTIWLCAASLLAPGMLQAQVKGIKTINTGAAFLLVNPDARSSGTGDAMTGLEPDANSLFGNAAKIVFADDWGVSASYAPWMWDLNNSDQRTNMGYISAFKNFKDNSEGIGLSMRYFSNGTIIFRDNNGTELQRYKPREYAIDASYARKLGTRYSLAITLRYIRSDLGQGSFNGLQQKPASAVAGDIGFYSQNYGKSDPAGNRYSWGIAFTNIGSKLNYTDDNDRRAFLPANLRIGGGYSFVNTVDHQFTILADVNKLLIPSPPVYELDADGQPTGQILDGKDPNRSMPEAIFTSFWDAPGGFQEEIREFTVAGGLEYTYQHQLFIRTGYFYEHPQKGYRQHFAAGIGTRIKGVSLDMAYIMPTANSLYQRKTLKFTLAYHVGGGAR
ncbi:type IX secretion system outer membrane channel protein PorV [Chitinophaga agri]|uniref:Type IX secretion system outer membrane channel protein PorV n=1 Tax=Chitinophaga agri TaxID=2703787 RepID=A0A6B9ZKC3_9BACT|nr:type IX secretion system outer membrane channel protein PorV [Chitinophaga agri]QHS62436.1 type IX secretion system outer membrane channel protein PorV [Chitinophaga agri]